MNGYRQLLFFLRKKGRKVSVKIAVRNGGVSVVDQLYLMAFQHVIRAMTGISKKYLTAYNAVLCGIRRFAINSDPALSVLK